MDLSLEVKQLLRDHTSIEQLVENTNIGYSTARRLYLGETKQVSPNNLLEIAAFISKKSDIKNIILHFPVKSNIRKSLQESFSCILNESSNESDFDVNSLIKSDVHYKIFRMACSEKGINKTFIEKEFGHNGVNVAEELILRGALIDSNDHLFATEVGRYINMDTELEYAPSLFDYLKPDNFDKATNIYNCHVNKISEKCRLEVLKRLTRTQREIIDLMRNDSEERTLPFFSLVFGESMITREGN